MEVKEALRDSRFRASLPLELQGELQKYMQNPGCGCNVPFYEKIINTCKKQLIEYFPGFEVVSIDEVKSELSKNNWRVINCNINDLENKLHELGPGRKQIAITRFEDKITLVVNELDYF